MRLRALLPAALAISLVGCGFSPMYGANAPGATNGRYIGPVVIDEIPGKGGFVLKAELEKLLQVENGEGPARRLKITIGEGIGGLGFRVDESASRSDLQIAASYSLYDANGTVVISGVATATASYDVPSSAYGEIAAQEDARERAAENLAVKIQSQLSMRLAAKKVSAKPSP
ncbi:MAG: LPS assembly lipoprotein LptE [Pseudomonadota bacterium]